MGQFRRNREGVGQFGEPWGALGSNLGANERLTLNTVLEHDLDHIIDAVDTVAADDESGAGSTDHDVFIGYNKRHAYYRNITEIRFMYAPRTTFPDCAFYIEHPESKQLLPIVRCVRDRRFNGAAIVWLSDNPCEDPMIVCESTMMYASDEPEVAGKTLEQVRERYGKD